MKPILISFSGGRTSAFMAKFLMEHPQFADQEKVVVFANTGKEFPETLDFVHECDQRWNLGVVWVEAKVIHEAGVGTTFTIVDYESASRKGEPFHEVIKKYGLSTKQAPHCTRELKQKPIKRYMQSLGYTDWHTAVGIRADEPHRLKDSNDPNFKNPMFPLAHIIKADERFIREWWSRQEFDLQLFDYQSNCDLCWKKSVRKRLTLISENPNIADWWNQMEILHGGEYRFDQREGNNISDLVEMAKQPFRKAVDKHEQWKQQPSLFEPEMDLEWDCFCKST